MKQLGKIVIKEKVYFEHEGLEKPNRENCHLVHEKYYTYAMKKYKASKQLVEVSNFWREFKNTILMIINEKIENIKDQQACKAEVTDKAVIIKIN